MATTNGDCRPNEEGSGAGGNVVVSNYVREIPKTLFILGCQEGNGDADEETGVLDNNDGEGHGPSVPLLAPNISVDVFDGDIDSPANIDDTGQTSKKPELSLIIPDHPEIKRGPIRRSSSLKSMSPTDKPQRKKSVQFMDDSGLDLIEVRVADLDVPPDVPDSALSDLDISPEELTEEKEEMMVILYLKPAFMQPVIEDDFFDRVENQKVCLETATASGMEVTGVVRVANIGFEKAVKVKYTGDGWKMSLTMDAIYIKHSSDGDTDRFSFRLLAPPNLDAGGNVEFCLCYTVNGEDYWDSNNGENYQMLCCAQGAW